MEEPKNIKVAADLHRQVKTYAAGRDETIQELTERVLRRELGQGDQTDGILDGLAKEDRRLVQRAAEALRSGTQHRPKIRKIFSDVLDLVLSE